MTVARRRGKTSPAPPEALCTTTARFSPRYRSTGRFTASLQRQLGRKSPRVLAPLRWGPFCDVSSAMPPRRPSAGVHTIARSNFWDISSAIGPNSCDDKSAVAYDVNSAGNKCVKAGLQVAEAIITVVEALNHRTVGARAVGNAAGETFKPTGARAVHSLGHHAVVKALLRNLAARREGRRAPQRCLHLARFVYTRHAVSQPTRCIVVLDGKACIAFHLGVGNPLNASGCVVSIVEG